MTMKQLRKLTVIALVFAFLSVLACPQETQAVQKPPAVQGLKKGTTSNNSINISWRQQDNVSGYQIYRSTAYDGKYKHIKDIAVGNQAFCNMKLNSGREYFYKVRAYASTGSGIVKGKFSKRISAYTKGGTRTAFVRVRANVRSHAGSNFAIRTTLDAGTQVKIVCAASDKKGVPWSRISYKVQGKSKTGYMRADLLSSSGSQQQPVSSTTGTVTASGLRMREQPSTSSRIITTLVKGTKVTILSQVTGKDGQKWYFIQARGVSGRLLKGYAAARYIKV
ncbi:MAG: SH3 domain-containing protein [Lachnospiraceae bacterium]|nr:SH3 domain-containing protein [Lachnospiraceae bacterium]